MKLRIGNWVLLSFSLMQHVAGLHAQNLTAVLYPETELNKFLLQNTISGLCSDSLGGIWAASQYGLLYSDGTDTRLMHMRNQPEIKANRFLGIYTLENGIKVAVNSRNQLFRLGKSGTLYPFNLDKGFSLVVHRSSAFIINLHEWQLPETMSKVIMPQLYHLDGKLRGFQVNGKWFGSTAKGGRKLKYYLRKKIGNNIFIRDDNELFYYVSGILKYHKVIHHGFEDIVGFDDTSTIVRLRNKLVFINLKQGTCLFTKSIEPLRMGEVIVIHPVNSKNFFIGTYNYGIYELNLLPVDVLTGPIPSVHKNLYIYSYARWRDTVFITSYQGLVQVSEKEQDRKMLRQSEVSSSSLFMDKESRLWSSQDDVIGYYTFPTGKFSALGNVPNTPELFFKSGNNIYFTIHEEIFKINNNATSFSKIGKIKGAVRFYAYRSTQSGNYLLSENGIYLVNANFEVLKNTHTGLIIRDLLETPKGVFLATYGDGLLRWEDGNQKKRLFNDRFDWSSAALSMRYDEKNNRLWLVCNKAIFILDLDRAGHPKPIYTILACGSELPSTELNGGDYTVIPGDEYYYFPSNDGLLKVPIHWDMKKTPSEIMMKSVISSGNRLDVSDDIHLKAAHRNLTIKLLLPFSFHEENEEQEYQLLPLFQQWRPIPENRQLLFSQLPPGVYTLWVKNANGTRRLTTIHVARFWFQETIFHLSVLLFVVGIVSLLIFIRTRTLRRRSMFLERAVEKKTAELQRNVISLEESQRMLQQETALRESMNSVLIHDIRSPLLFLTQSGYNLNNVLKERYPEALDSANVLAGTVKDLYILSSDYIVWLKNRRSGSRAETETLKLYEIMEEIFRFYQPICSSNSNSIEFNCDPEEALKTFCTDGQLLRCVLRNLIDNSNKFTRNGRIMIGLRHDQGFADITIYDNGIGLPAHILTTFAKRSKENPNLWTLKAMHTEEIGMNMILQFAEILNGVITYERLPEGRSKFQLRLKELSCQSSDAETSLKSMP